MHGESLFFQAFIYLSAAVVAVPIAKRLGLGSVLGYLLAGVVIGPFVLGLVGSEGQDVMHFAEFGVVLMLFLIGMELEPATLWRMRGPIFGLGGLQVVCTTAAIAGIAIALGQGVRPAIAIGMTLALSSTAIVLQTLREKGLMRTAGGRGAFAVLLLQDVAVIPMLAIMPLLAADAAAHVAGEHGTTWTADLPPWAKTVVVLGAMTAIVVVGRFVVGPAFRAVARTRVRELFTAAGLALMIGIALLMSRVGLSPALGTFLAGVVLANSEYRHELESDIEPFKGLLLGLFFISVGAAIDFDLILERPGMIGGLVVTLLAVKWVVLLALGRLFRLGTDPSLLFAFALAQAGEFAFVLFSFATGVGVLDPSVTAPLVAVVAVSMAVTPVLLIANDRLIRPRFGTRATVERESDVEDDAAPVIIAGFGRFGHLVGRFLLAQGVPCAILDTDSDQVDMLRNLGLRVYYGDASRRDILAAAGAESARALVVAVDGGAERVLAVAETARRHFPHLAVFARARGRLDAYELLDAGIDRYYRETADTSLRLGVDVLRHLGHRGHAAHRAARSFLRHDERGVRDLARFRHDRTDYYNRARVWIRDVERLLREETDPSRKAPDEAWDASSLRRDAAPRTGDDGSTPS